MKLYACRCGCSTPVLMYRPGGSPTGQQVRSTDFYIRRATEAGVRWVRPGRCSADFPRCPACDRRVYPSAQHTAEVQPEDMPPSEFAALALALYAKGPRDAVRVYRLSAACQAWERAHGG